ncbi:G-protein coupled receptor family C group 6 member A, partial [Xenopus laevis]|uniref:G-protein coupled receptor family C group 6 member A n=1 Tax=Xenopus laevis TaxID=8355 RepID=A0A8J0TMC5_XENLA
MSSVVESSVVDHSFNSRTHLRRFEYNPCSTRRCRQFLVSHFLKYYRHYLAAIFAIEEINKDTNILPNITLGFHIYDTCSSERQTVANITYGTQDSSFNDRIHFPTLYNTMTSENTQDKVIIYLLKTFNWTWVGIVASDDGNHHIRNEKLKVQIINSGAACVEFFIVVKEKYLASMFDSIKTIKKSTANVVIVGINMRDFFYIFWSLAENSERKIVWIFLTITSIEFVNYQITALNGSLLLELPQGNIPGLQEFIYSANPLKFPRDPITASLWDEMFFLPTGKGTINNRNETLKTFEEYFPNFNTYRLTYNTYVSVYALGHALHNMYMDSIGNRLDPSKFLSRFMPWKIPHSTCSKNCPPGSRKILIKEKPICCYNCIQCSEGEVSTVSDMENCVKCPKIQWSNEQRDKCIMRTLDFLSFEDVLGLSLALMANFLSVLTTTVLIIFIKYKHTTIVKANNRELSYYLLISLILSFLCFLLFIGWPTKGTCLIRQVVFAIVFTFSISCVLGKTLTVVIAFSATRPGSKLRGWVGTRIPKCIVLLCTLVEIVICSLWLINSPPFPEFDTESQRAIMILQCNEGSAFAFYTMIGYIGLLAFICLFVAYLSRNLPDIFNEAQYITFSMLVFCSVWISFIPAYLSTKGKYLTSVEIFAILASGSGLLGLIFIPKCYIILFKPEKKTRIY